MITREGKLASSPVITLEFDPSPSAFARMTNPNVQESPIGNCKNSAIHCQHELDDYGEFT